MQNKPTLIVGKHHTDERGTITFNNDFDLSEIKRAYFIENETTDIIRAWQGHKIEQRCFTVVKGSFLVKVIQIDNWDNPSTTLAPFIFHLSEKDFQVLQVPGGYASSIQAMEENSKLMVMGDYLLGETKDEHRYSSEYFDIK